MKAEASTLPSQAAVSANAPWSACGAVECGGSSEEENLRSSHSPTVQRFSKNWVAPAIVVPSFLLRQVQQTLPPHLEQFLLVWSEVCGCVVQESRPHTLQCVPL